MGHVHLIKPQVAELSRNEEGVSEKGRGKRITAGDQKEKRDKQEEGKKGGKKRWRDERKREEESR